MTPPREPTLYERLNDIHIPRLTQFHLENLGGKLTWLGPSYIRYFYQTALKQKGTFGWIALRNAEVVGCVVGSIEGGTLLGRMIRESPLRWLFQSIGSGVLHPLLFFRVAISVLRGTAPSRRPYLPELHYIAVRADARGQSVGDQLMRYFATELSTRSQSEFGLSVSQNNPLAIRFYEKHGGKPAGDYAAAGQKMRRFSFKVQQVLEEG